MWWSKWWSPDWWHDEWWPLAVLVAVDAGGMAPRRRRQPLPYPDYTLAMDDEAVLVLLIAG